MCPIYLAFWPPVGEHSLQLKGADRLIRSGVALCWDLGIALGLQALFDHTWWLGAIRLQESIELSMGLELALFLGLWRFVTTLIWGVSWGQWLAGLSSEVDRLTLSGVVWIDILLSPLILINALVILVFKSSFTELIFGPMIRSRIAPRKVSLLLTRLPLGTALIVVVAAFHGVLSRSTDAVRVATLVETPIVVNYEKSTGQVYSSNRFRVRLTSDLRNSLGVRRVSLIPSFEVERRVGKKLFYPQLVVFDRETKGFASLSLYKELDYEQFMSRSRVLDPTWNSKYPKLADALNKSRALESLAEARDFQNFLLDILNFDVSPIKSVIHSPLSSRSRSRALFDLFNLLDLGFAPEVTRLVLSNESFIRLRGVDELGHEREYWLSTRGPRLRVFELGITKGSQPWNTSEVLPVLFKDAKWDWMADLPFPVALLKDEVNALSVVDLYTKPQLGPKEKEEVERFLFFHFFELARDSLVFKQAELQNLIIDTLERFLIIASSSGSEKGSTLYSKRFQQKLSDLKESLSTKDHNYYKIQ